MAGYEEPYWGPSYNACSDWLILGHHSPIIPTHQLRACKTKAISHTINHLLASNVLWLQENLKAGLSKQTQKKKESETLLHPFIFLRRHHYFACRYEKNLTSHLLIDVRFIIIFKTK